LHVGHLPQALINAIMDCQETHVVITQLFLPIALLLQPDPPLKTSHITALVAYSQDSHATIGSLLKAIKMLQ